MWFRAKKKGRSASASFAPNKVRGAICEPRVWLADGPHWPSLIFRNCPLAIILSSPPNGGGPVSSPPTYAPRTHTLGSVRQPVWAREPLTNLRPRIDLLPTNVDTGHRCSHAMRLRDGSIAKRAPAEDEDQHLQHFYAPQTKF